MQVTAWHSMDSAAVVPLGLLGAFPQDVWYSCHLLTPKAASVGKQTTEDCFKSVERQEVRSEEVVCGEGDPDSITPGRSQLLSMQILTYHGRQSTGWLRSVVFHSSHPASDTKIFFSFRRQRRRKWGLALVKCWADSFTTALGRGAERRSIRFNQCWQG